MLCGKCGTQNAEGQTACTNCGAALADGKEKPKKKGKLGTLLLILIAALSLYAAVAMSGVLGGKSTPEEAATYIAEAMLAGDAQKVAGMIPKEGWKVLNDSYGIANQKEFTERLNVGLSQIKEMKSQGVKMRCVGTHLSMNGLSSWKAAELRKAGINATNACNAHMDIMLSYEWGNKEETLPIPLIQIGGKWYLDFSNIFYMGVF